MELLGRARAGASRQGLSAFFSQERVDLKVFTRAVQPSGALRRTTAIVVICATHTTYSHHGPLSSNHTGSYRQAYCLLSDLSKTFIHVILCEIRLLRRKEGFDRGTLRKMPRLSQGIAWREKEKELCARGYHGEENNNQCKNTMPFASP